MATGPGEGLEKRSMASRKRRDPPSGKTAKRSKPPKDLPAQEARSDRQPPAPPNEEDLKDGRSPEVKTSSLASSRGRGLARADPLQLYMQEVSRHPLLTREQEYELAVRYRETGDLDAAYRLVASTLRFVGKLRHEYHRNPLLLLELIQEGDIGLVHAVDERAPGRRERTTL